MPFFEDLGNAVIGAGKKEANNFGDYGAPGLLFGGKGAESAFGDVSSLSSGVSNMLGNPMMPLALAGAAVVVVLIIIK